MLKLSTILIKQLDFDNLLKLISASKVLKIMNLAALVNSKNLHSPHQENIWKTVYFMNTGKNRIGKRLLKLAINPYINTIYVHV